MSELTLKKDWTRWSPHKIFLINIKDDDTKFLYTKKIIEKKLYIDIERNKNVDNANNILEDVQTFDGNNRKIKYLQEEAYQKGFTEGYKKSETVFKNKIKKLFIGFENSLLVCENLLFSHLLKIVLKVSAYVIGKNVNIDESSLLKYIKKITLKDNFFLKKPKLVVNSCNKKIVEDIFLDSLNMHNWQLAYDDNIDLNGCAVISDRGDIEATVSARWQELCRLVRSEACT